MNIAYHANVSVADNKPALMVYVWVCKCGWVIDYAPAFGNGVIFHSFNNGIFIFVDFF